MRVKVMLVREEGQLHVPVRRRGYGDLWLKHERSVGEDKTYEVLEALGSGFPKLYEPRVTYITAGMIRFIGYERIDKVWYMQEWHCEIDRSK